MSLSLDTKSDGFDHVYCSAWDCASYEISLQQSKLNQRRDPAEKLLNVGSNPLADAIMHTAAQDPSGLCRYEHMFSQFFDTPTKQGYTSILFGSLRLGMQIWIDLPWYKHPFPKNRFKLATPKQLQTIRSLKLDCLFYHPTLSDPESATVPDDTPPPTLTGLHALIEDEAISQPAERRLSVTPRLALQQANTLYSHTLRRSREALKQIADGKAIGAIGVKAIVSQFTQQLMQPEASLGVADVIHLNGMDQAQAVHGLNTCLLALLVGRDLELPANDLTLLGLAGLMHDVGEHRLQSSIRFKREPLTRAELKAFQRHPIYSKDLILELLSIPPEIAGIVEQHHEHLDGNGYPHGLSATQIHPLAQILAVVDEYQDLVSPQFTQDRLQPNQALSELYVKRQASLSIKVITALVRVLSVYPPGTLVELSDGSIGVVANVNPADRLRPIIVVYESTDQDLETRIVDLGDQSHLTILRMVQMSELAPAYLNRITPTEVLKFMLLTDVQPQGQKV
jgi:HD-GYP domain-containing protein (c-di-GMP phosphodiesterase class II)